MAPDAEGDQSTSLAERLFPQRPVEPGARPGTVVHTGERIEDEALVTVIDYDEDAFTERVVDDVAECFEFKETATVTWVNVDGLHETDVIEALGDEFDLHPLLVEDVCDTNQRPKVEEYDDYVYVTLRMVYYDEAIEEVHSEQVSLIVGTNFVFSFQETEGDVFDAVRDRIRNAKGRIRREGPGYLAYALIDTVVDHYFVMLEQIGDDVEELEAELVDEPEDSVLQDLHRMKRELLYLRKSVWPLREVLNTLQRHESPQFSGEVQVYLRDVYDHTIQVIDMMETLREMVSGMLDIYLSSVNNRMSEVMKVLTIVATIFIPLTFLAGIWGMNFEAMPELTVPWAYPAVLLGMAVIGVVMLAYFRSKDWI